MSTPKPKYMICSCCGGAAGRWRQWFNRDTGYGLCEDCIDFVADSRSISSFEDFRDLYGEPGKHYARLPKRFAEGAPA